MLDEQYRSRNRAGVTGPLTQDLNIKLDRLDETNESHKIVRLFGGNGRKCSPEKNDLTNFYRATVCVSAVFAVVRDPSVRPSVCLSIALEDCIHTAEDSVKLLILLGISIILVFEPQCRYLIPRRNPSAGAQNTRGGIFCNFRLKSRFISETVRDRPIVAMER